MNKNQIRIIEKGPAKPFANASGFAGVLVALAVVILMLTLASSAGWAQGLPLKTCSNQITAYLCKGDILVADGNSDNGKGRIILVDPVTGSQTSIAHGDPYLDEPVGVIFDPNDNNLLVINGVAGGTQINGVVRVNPGTGAQTLVSSGFNAPFALALDGNGDIFVADSGYAATDPNNPLVNQPGRIIKVDRKTGTQTLWATGGFISHPYGIAFDAGNTGLLYVTDATSFNGQGAIYSLDPANINSPPRLVWGPATASPAPVVPQSAPMGCPLGITVEATGNLLATAFSYPAPPPNAIYGCVPPGIFRVDLMARRQVTMIDNNTTPPLSWNLPFGIDTEDNGTSTGNIIVVDEGLKMVFRLNPTPYNPLDPLASFIAPIPLSRDGFFVTPVNLSLRKTQPTVNIAQPPSVSIVAPASSPEGTAINLTSNVSGSGTPTYSWTVTKNGSAFASGSAASLTFTPDDNGTYAVGLAVVTSAGTGSASATITVTNVVPSVSITNIPSNSLEGTPISLNSTVTDPSAADTAAGFTYSWTVTKNGSTVASGSGTSLNFTPNDNGTYAVTLTAGDKDLGAGSATTNITVTNVAPSATILGIPVSSSEGTAITLTSTASDPSSADTAAGFLYSWTVLKNSTAFASGSGTSLNFTPDDNGTYAVTLSVTDKDGSAGSVSASIVVSNVAPVIPSGGVTGPTVPLALGTPSTVVANFTDAGTKDTHTCLFAWDDLSTTSVSGSPGVSETNGSGSCRATRTFAGPGVYNVNVTVTDGDGGSISARVSQYVVIFDPAEGSVSGSGWIDSLPGAYLPNPALVGKAKFGFESKYKRGASVPTGQTEFNFKAAKFKFKSTVYEWLVISGSKAQYTGSGVVRVHDSSHSGDDECENDNHWRQWTGDYKFILTAQDGGLSDGKDKFRIKIVDKATLQVIYDNKRGESDDMDVANPQIISGGRITIKKN